MEEELLEDGRRGWEQLVNEENEPASGTNLQHKTLDKVSPEKETSPFVPNQDEDAQTKPLKTWMICASCFLIIAFAFGIHLSFGVFLPEYLREFKQSDSKTALVGSLAANLMFTSFPLAGALSNLVSVYMITNVGAALMVLGLLLTSFMPSLDVMILTYSIIFSVGSGLAVALLFVVVPVSCQKRKSLAAGILMSATSFGMIALPPVTEALITNFGWRYTLRMLSLVSLGTVILSLPLKHYERPSHDDTKSRREKLCPDLTLFRSRSYILWVVGASIGLMCHSVPNTFMIMFAKHFRGEKCSSKSSLLLTSFGILSLQSRIVFGFISDYIFSRKMYLCACSMFIIALASFACALHWSYWMLIGYILISGCLDGALTGLLSVLTLEVTGTQNYKDGWTLFIFIHSNIMMIGPPLAGWLVDRVGSYEPIFSLRGFTLFIGSLVLLFIPFCEAKAKREILETQEEMNDSVDARKKLKKSFNIRIFKRQKQNEAEAEESDEG